MVDTPNTKEQQAQQPNIPLEPKEEERSDYAKKKPLITKWFLIKTLAVIVAIAVIVFLVILITATIKARNVPPTRPEIKPPEVIENPTVEDTLPSVAYIKNDRSIWITNTKGENRINLVDLDAFKEDGKITSIDWYSKDQLAYSTCNNGCTIYLISVSNKAQTAIVQSAEASIIERIKWSNNRESLAYIEVRGGKTYYNLKSGNLTGTLESFYNVEDKSGNKNKIVFADDDNYVIFESEKTDEKPNQNDKNIVTYSAVTVYRPNGIKVDEIKDATSPFLIGNSLMGYEKNNALLYKTIGASDEISITTMGGLNPEISPNKKLIGFWSNESEGQKKIILQIYDTQLNIRRDILRGIVLPIWLDDKTIAGIKLDSCLGENCLLYEFQTAGFVLVDISNSKTKVVDQGDSIAEITLNRNAD